MTKWARKSKNCVGSRDGCFESKREGEESECGFLTCRLFVQGCDIRSTVGCTLTVSCGLVTIIIRSRLVCPHLQLCFLRDEHPLIAVKLLEAFFHVVQAGGDEVCLYGVAS